MIDFSPIDNAKSFKFKIVKIERCIYLIINFKDVLIKFKII